MDLLRKDRLLKLRKKNRGNIKLVNAIDKLIQDFESADWKNRFDLIKDRLDADSVHGDNFYFFDINIHRTMIMVLFHEQEAEILWVGNHDAYDFTFKGNKKTIETWLRNQGKIK
ncbi:MAG: type II toxin-antitoxin system HigB family toxin [Cyclobacteriaceae bacterium]